MKQFKYLSITFTLFLLFCQPESTSIEDCFYFSSQLQRKAEYLVLHPSDFAQKKKMGHRYPVLYLLHCAGCSHYSYTEQYPLTGLVDSFDMLIVIPFDGTTFGWWLDSPIDTLSHLSTWLSGEFKQRIDSLYPTLPDRENTGIAGHSMGGFGALHNYIHHYAIYGSAFSAKGRLEINGRNGTYRIAEVIGDFNEFSHHYDSINLFTTVHKLQKRNTSIMFYSGPNDRFPTENRLFDTLLTELDIDHHYFENSEDHFLMSAESVRKMLSFFDSCFTRNQKD